MSGQDIKASGSSAECSAAPFEGATVDSDVAAAATHGPLEGGINEYMRTYVQRLRGGEMCSVPAVAGIVALMIFFSIVHQGFLTYYNLENLVTQAAPIALMAMGLVPVLLLGEIDLSAGTTSGVCAALASALLARENQAWYTSIVAAIGVGVAVGLLIGWLRAKVRIPSFVITLAFFLAFQGITLLIVGNAGSISVSDNVVMGIEGQNGDLMPVWLGWVLLIVFVAGFAAVKVYDSARRRAAGLVIEPLPVTLFKIVGLGALGAGFVYIMNVNRSLQHNAFFSSNLEGMPYVVLIVLGLLVIWTFVLNRTRYGRHVYAVGGNEEASRRAGVRVDRVRISVFVICSSMAAVSGLVSMSRLGSVASDLGAKQELLLAVGAAVIGGTSLFGGRGRMIDGVLGGLVVAIIQNGMADLIQGANSSAWQYIVTGLVLLLAAGVDAISRRRAGATGLG
jgi:D-xylose transport system permease protein